MNINRHSLRTSCFALLASLFAASALADASISNVSARQRWPWNSLVDVDFTVDGAAQGETFRVSVSATATMGGREANFHASSFATEPIAKAGANRVVWDFGADYPDTRVDDLLVTVTATPFSDTTPVYLVVDISSGKNATKWPVRYTTLPPVHTPGVEDPCKTTELWLKRVKAGSISIPNDPIFGQYAYPSYTCVLTEDYYLGVFELTQAQCYNIKGSYHSKFTNALYRATRPVDTIASEVNIRNPPFDSSNPDAATDNSCIIGRLRQRTGLAFDLPTEWQWEYACRAGETGQNYNQGTYRSQSNSQPPNDYEWKGTRGMWSADYGTSYVDQYPPNRWGFYGIIGNVAECCLNLTASISAGDTLTDPQGPAGTGRRRRFRGGMWTTEQQANNCRYAWGEAPDSWNGTINWAYGARICLTIKKTADYGEMP